MMTHYQPDITVLTGDQIWSEGVIDQSRVYKINGVFKSMIRKLQRHLVITIQRASQTFRLTRAIEDQYSTNYVQKNHSLIVDDKEAYTIKL